MSSNKPPESNDVGQIDAHSLSRIAARVFDTPLLIHEGKLHQILQVLGPRLGFDVAPQPAEVPAGTHAARYTSGIKWEWNSDGGFYVVGRVGVIPVIGTLVQRSSWIDAYSGLKSYESIEQSALHAMEDRDIDELVFDYDTSGGEAAGAFDAADRLAALRGRKPMSAVVNEYAASAGYLLASTADRVVIPRTGYAGSVGVVTAHVDQSKALEKRGVVVTFVYAGEKKVDGNPYEPLPDHVRAEWQAEIDNMYSIFVDTVARNRGLDAERVRSTEAGMYMGSAAKDVGFADELNTLTNVVHNVNLRRGGAFRLTMQSRGVPTMTDGERAEREKAVAEARAEGVAAGRKEALEGVQADQQKAVAEATTGERARIKAIVTSEEAKGREQMASHLAFETDQSSESAIALLKAAPKADAKGPLGAAMDQIGTPGIRSSEQGTERREQPRVDTTAFFAKLNEPYEVAIGQREPARQ